MSADDIVQIQIRCPKCTQRFRVGPELKGRMVECGACEYRFRVDDESLVKNRKFYPGEKKDPMLMRYGRQPHMEFAVPEQQDVVHYAEAPGVESIEPTPLGKIIIGLFGSAAMAITLLVLMTSGSENGFLDGVTTDRRLVIAAFAAVVGAAMIIYANPRSRVKATLFALLAAAALIATPFFFKEGSTAVVSKPLEIAPVILPVVVNEEAKIAADLKYSVGYVPIENALIEAGKEGRVVGIWLKGLLGSNSELVKTYLIRVSGAASSSHLYPRSTKHYLLVLVNPRMTIEELVLECERLGEVDNTFPDMHLIDATVDNSRFEEPAVNKLSDKKDGAFYQLNLYELQCIDIRRVNEALVRLSLAEPVQSRDDIIKRMKELLPMSDREMLINLAQALTVWSDGTDGAPEEAMKVALLFYKKEQKLPLEIVSFLTKWQQPEIYPILEKLWLENITTWEAIFLNSGPLAEPRVLPHLTTGDNQRRMSAARIASRVGGEASVTALKNALNDTEDQELQTSFRNALEVLEKRDP